MSAGVPLNPAASTSVAARVPIDLLRRYDRPGPRYTSYPTAVEFHEGFDERAYSRTTGRSGGGAIRTPVALHPPAVLQ